MSTDLTALETLHLDTSGLPEVPFIPYSEHVTIKLLRIDRASGQIAVILKGPPGARIGRHKHYGSVILYTIRGAWRYLEHDWVAKEGSFVYEPPGEIHTLVVDEQVGATEMITFFNIHGAMVYVDEAGEVTGYEDVFTKIGMCRRHYAGNGLGEGCVDQFVR